MLKILMIMIKNKKFIKNQLMEVIAQICKICKVFKLKIKINCKKAIVYNNKNSISNNFNFKI